MRLTEDSYQGQALFLIICPTIIAIFLFFSSVADAAEWSVNPRLTIRETYTDNVRLGSGFRGAGSKQDDFITEINPGLSVTGLGRRVNVNAFYTMNNLIYARNKDLTRIRHQLNAKATTEIIEDLFFLDGNALMFQQNTTLLGPQAIDNTNVTGNRTSVRAYNISPYLRHRFQNFASTELRYAHGIVESGANGLRNSQRNSVLLNLNSGDSFKILTWGLNYSYQRIHFDGNTIRAGRNVELERSIANFRYNITPRFGLTATGGYERNSFVSIRGNPSSPTWSAGFAWLPNERTDISASAGQRFFGDTYAAQVNHRTRSTTWSASYNEDITTFNQQAQLGTTFGTSVIDTLPVSGLPNTFLSADNLLSTNNFLTNRLFLQRRLQASVTVNGARNTVSLRVFNMSRKAFSPADLDIDLLGIENVLLLNNTRQTGGNVSWSYRFSPRTSVNMNASFIRFKFFSVNRIDDNQILMMSLIRQFQPNLTGVFQLRRIQRDSNREGNDFNSNSVIASLNMNF